MNPVFCIDIEGVAIGSALHVLVLILPKSLCHNRHETRPQCTRCGTSRTCGRALQRSAERLRSTNTACRELPYSTFWYGYLNSISMIHCFIPVMQA